VARGGSGTKAPALAARPHLSIEIRVEQSDEYCKFMLTSNFDNTDFGEFLSPPAAAAAAESDAADTAVSATATANSTAATAAPDAAAASALANAFLAATAGA